MDQESGIGESETGKNGFWRVRPFTALHQSSTIRAKGHDLERIPVECAPGEDPASSWQWGAWRPGVLTSSPGN